MLICGSLQGAAVCCDDALLYIDVTYHCMVPVRPESSGSALFGRGEYAVRARRMFLQRPCWYCSFSYTVLLGSMPPPKRYFLPDYQWKNEMAGK